MSIDEAARAGAGLVAFGEALVPGYPMWVSRTDGGAFDDPVQKGFFARYAEHAVTIEDGHLEGVQAAARRGKIVVVLGVVERPRERGCSLYCSCVVIRADGSIGSVHRKLVPTYEERLVWGHGDGAGLVTHELGEFRLGALNCWENWMPLARAALHAQGETLHVALWPGRVVNTEAITRFIAREGRSFVLSASSLLRVQDVPTDLAQRDRLVAGASESGILYDGGSCIAGPDGEWVVAPVAEREGLILAELDARRVLEERQNFDPSGHYARPDVLRLGVNRVRGAVLEMSEPRL